MIEDGAQSFGAEQLDENLVIYQILVARHFPTKPLGCYGDGGAIFTSDDNLARSIRQIARHGQEKDTSTQG